MVYRPTMQEVANEFLIDKKPEIVRKGLEVHSLSQLLITELPAMRWIVDGLIGEGLTMFAGKPKMGKSFMVLGLAMAVASGGVAMGKIKVKQGRVLYLALEDNPYRIQQRAKAMLGEELLPDNVDIVYTCSKLGEGLEGDLRAYLTEHDDVRMVIIDTLQRTVVVTNGNSNDYGKEYEVAGILQKIAIEHHIAIVAVHHTRKTPSGDPFDEISGSVGPFAAADTALILKRDRTSHKAKLITTGRDIAEQELDLVFSEEAKTWIIDGDGPKIDISPERRRVLEVINRRGQAHIRDIMTELNLEEGAVKKRLSDMKKQEYVIAIGKGYYKAEEAYSEIGLEFGDD